jgi:hypothetical protein
LGKVSSAWGARLSLGFGLALQHWLGLFYPDKLLASEMLAFYALHFGTVELNNGLCHLPTQPSITDGKLIPITLHFPNRQHK